MQVRPRPLLEGRRNHSRNRILFKYLLSECQDLQLKDSLMLSSSTSVVDFCDTCQNVVVSIQKLHLELEVVQMKLIDKLKQLRKLITANSRSTQDSAEMEETEGGAGAGNDTFVQFQRFIRESEGKTAEIPLIFLKQSVPVEFQLKLNSIPLDLQASNATVETESSSPNKNIKEVIVTPGECPSMLVKQETEEDEESTTSDDDHVDNHLDEMHHISSSSSSSEEEIRDVKPPTRRILKRGTSCQPKKGEKKKRMRISSKSTCSSSENGSTSEEQSQVSSENSSSSESEDEREQKAKSLLPKNGFYRCDLCSYRAEKRVEFENHLRKEHQTEEKPFQCPKCPIKFSVKQALSFHLRFRHTQLRSKVKCDLCASSVRGGQAWKDHLKRKHSDEKLFHCDLCGEVFLSFVKLILHSRRHYGAKLKCTLCPNPEETNPLLSLVIELPLHLDKAHGVADLKLECDAPNCSKVFYFPRYLYAHKRKWHPTDFSCKKCETTFSSLADLHQHNSQLHPILGHICKICSARFISSNMLTAHKIREHNHPKLHCELCPPPGRYFVTKPGLNSHKQVYHSGGNGEKFSVKTGQAWKYHLKGKRSDQQLFHCDSCGKVFWSFVKLIIHSRRHPGAKLKCALCPNPSEETKPLFSVIIELPRHLDKVHGVTDLKLECDTPNCSKVFYFPRYLYEHKRKWHPTDFRCKKCETTFSSLADLHQHNSRLHPKLSHVCKICSARFVASNMLQAHKIREHNHPKLHCELCPPPGRYFETKPGLNSHKQVYHSGENGEKFLCSKCPKIFPTKLRRDAHERIHAETKDFTCDKCGEAFKSNTTLQDHLRRMHATANSKELFCCEKCGYTTTSGRSLRNHMLKHHKSATQV